MSNISTGHHSEPGYMPLYPCSCAFDLIMPDTSTPLSMTIHIISNVFLVISGFMINLKLYKDLQAEHRIARGKRERGNILYYTLTTYSIVQITVRPLGRIYMTIVVCGLLDPIRYSFWMCHITRWMLLTQESYLAFHSLSSALVRYAFIMHENKVNRFGAEKTQKFFQYVSVLFPVVLMSLWQVIDAPLVQYYLPEYRECIEAAYNATNVTDPHLPDKSYFFPFYIYLTTVFPDKWVDGANIALGILAVVAFCNLVEMPLYYIMFKDITR